MGWLTKNFAIYTNTGIGNANYVGWRGMGSTQDFVNLWFTERREQLSVFGDLSAVQLESSSNHPHGNSVHLPIPVQAIDAVGADYVSWQYEEPDGRLNPRVYYAIITTIESVNANSCRFYLVLDYCATYWDLLSLRKSNVVRRSTSKHDDEYTNSLSDGYSPMMTEKELPVANFLASDFTLSDITIGLCAGKVLNIVLPYQIDSTREKPAVEKYQAAFQAGSAVGGSIYLFEKEDIDIDTGESAPAPSGAAVKALAMQYQTALFKANGLEPPLRLAAEGGGKEGEEKPRLKLTQLMNLLSATDGIFHRVGADAFVDISAAYVCPPWVAASTSPAAEGNKVKTLTLNPKDFPPAMMVNDPAKLGILNAVIIPALTALAGAQGALAPNLPIYVPASALPTKTWTLKDVSKFYGYEFKNPKIMNYVSYVLRSSTQECEVSPFQLKNAKQIPVMFYATGGESGCLRAVIQTKGVNPSSIVGAPTVCTPAWAGMALSGAPQTNKAQLTGNGEAMMWALFGGGKAASYLGNKIAGRN